ncbi:hypothetical protein K3495_g12657, partial [Podosphaera aphanis]
MELIHNSTATICKTSSRGVGCLHRAKVINKTRTADDDDTGKWEVFVEIAGHVKVSETGATPPAPTHQIYIAHEASLSPSSHPAHRKRNQEQRLKLRSLFDQGLESKRVWKVFRQDSKGVPHVTLQDIYAERAGYRSEKLAGRTSTQALLDELQEDVDWWYHYHTGLLGNITTLFFTHKKCITMLRRWPYVLLLDATYQANKFSLPLLHITGVSCTGHTFTIGFCFLSKEDEYSYSTAISWLRELLDGTEPTVFITDKDSS